MIEAFKALDSIARYCVVYDSPLDDIIAVGIWLILLAVFG